VARVPPRLLERDQASVVPLPPWALDPARGECTTLSLLAPVPTQFVVRFHPWPGLPSALASSAGALQITRCGAERIALLQVSVEMRSPRAVLHALVAVSNAAPTPLESTLPARDTGPIAPSPEPGAARPREPLTERLRRFELTARRDGALELDALELRAGQPQRFALAAGCYRLLASSTEPRPYRLLLRDPFEREPRRLDASESGDLTRELCAVRERSLVLEVEAPDPGLSVQLASARFPLPLGLPGRFGPQTAERLTETLGGSSAPHRLGLLVSSSIGAQGRTRLPRVLPTSTCYLAVVTPLHGEPASLSIAVTSGAWSGQASSGPEGLGTKLAFCVDKAGQADLDVEARGLGVAWLLLLFRAGPGEVSQAGGANEARP
jgi:hypothetical protein